MIDRNSKEQKLREALGEIDKYKKWSREADQARNSIRIGNRPGTRSGVLGFIERVLGGREFVPLSEGVTNAVYQALGEARDRYNREAEKLVEKIEGGE